MSHNLVQVTYSWKDEPDEQYSGTICVGPADLTEKEDEQIFFYVDSQEELEALTSSDNGEDFVITLEKEGA